ncbi:MAG: stearoyl-CoA desaturase (delta-9 desaturase) [Thalassolituus oleivorans]|jgi:stearoyl-CoA desaturase (delta-9 desaturase)|tara:strand:+ start:1202 stop:2368 length:1167 start_codon:yes stop_codon:yes gene_type:complete
MSIFYTENSMSEQHNKENAPINWVPAIMFAVTTLGVLTIVPWYGITYGYSTSAWVAYAVITWLTGMSITGGYHRLWSHNSYEAHPLLRIWYALWGAAALENTILHWSSGHRVHHRHVDDVELDPYSAKRGFWFSHMGWMLREYKSGIPNFDNVKNLMKDPIVMWQYKYYGPIVLVMNIGVPLALGFIFGDVWGMLLLAGLLRIVTTHHVTFFINSIAHKWGSQPYTDENTARDNAFFAFLTHGEGYHNYHHIFQTDYRNGIRWYHWDPTKWFIAACSWVGLTSNLRVVPDFKIERAKVKMQFKHAQEKLAKAENSEKWTVLLEKEYEEFREMLNEWTELQSERLDETRKHLREKWESAAIHTRFKELDYSLKMQSKRLQAMMAEARVA